MTNKKIGRPKGRFKHISPLTNREVCANEYYRDCRKIRLLQKREQDLEELNINRVQIWTQISLEDRKRMNLWCKRRGMTQTDFIRTAIRELCSKLLKEELQYRDLKKIK